MKDLHTIFHEELDNLPSDVKRFINKRGSQGEYAKTLEYYTGAYGLAFDKLAAQELEGWAGRSQLAEPLFFLCRHSIELSIKAAIREYSEPQRRIAEGHSLIQLWRELITLIDNADLGDGSDDWTVYCEKLIKHIHDADPDGERFRYPSDKGGQVFELTRFELEGLAVAHWHIGMYCDGSIGMLQDLGRQHN
jgi:hypothetical protein